MRRALFTALVVGSGALAQGTSATSSSNPPQATYESPPPTAAQGQQASSQPSNPGRWIHDDQAGWVWVPDNPQTSYASDDDYPSVYAYYPAYGWRWVAAPWAWGLYGGYAYGGFGVSFGFGVGYGYGYPYYSGYPYYYPYGGYAPYGYRPYYPHRYYGAYPGGGGYGVHPASPVSPRAPMQPLMAPHFSPAPMHAAPPAMHPGFHH